MSDLKSATPDHEQIYLEPPCCADPSEGRQWCQDDVSDCKDGREATRYVRADLAEADRAAQAKRIEELESQLAEEERDHLRTIDERDQFEKRIVEIGWSIGLLESDLEWSNLNDVGERCVQRAEELLSQIDSACVVINAFKSFQMLMDGKIDEPTFNSIIQGAEKDMARAAEWLNEYVNAAVEQLASTEKYNEALRDELDQSRTERDAAIQRAEAVEIREKEAVARHCKCLEDFSAFGLKYSEMEEKLAAIQVTLPPERALEIAECLDALSRAGHLQITRSVNLRAYAAALGKEGSGDAVAYYGSKSALSIHRP